jgi:predicted lipoprotein with Yx(FWY)xxD motif
MSRPRLALMAVATALLAMPAAAQPLERAPSPALSPELPAGISIGKTAVGTVYADAHGRTLYGLDTVPLVVETRTPDAWCSGPCAEVWLPVAPPPGLPAAPPALMRLRALRGGGLSGPDWSVAEGAHGPQLMFKGSNLVFVRKGDKPGSVAWNGAENALWNVLRYIPPAPKVLAPTGVAPVLVKDGYVLAEGGKHILYTLGRAFRCIAPCATPAPFRAGFVGHGVGVWTVSRDGDFAQWEYRGKPVFVGSSDVASVPAGAAILRPDPN